MTIAFFVSSCEGNVSNLLCKLGSSQEQDDHVNVRMKTPSKLVISRVSLICAVEWWGGGILKVTGKEGGVRKELKELLKMTMERPRSFGLLMQTTDYSSLSRYMLS